MARNTMFKLEVPDGHMEPLVFSGDRIRVERCQQVHDGELVVVSPRGHRTLLLGILRRRVDEFVLQRTNWTTLMLGTSAYFDLHGRVAMVEAGGEARRKYFEKRGGEPQLPIGVPCEFTLERAREFDREHDEFEEISPAIPLGIASALRGSDLPRIVHPSEIPPATQSTPIIREVQFDPARLSSSERGASRMFQALRPLDDIGRPEGEILITRQPERIRAGMLLVCKVNREEVVRYVRLDHRLRVSLESKASRSAPLYLAQTDEIEILGEVIAQQLEM